MKNWGVSVFLRIYQTSGFRCMILIEVTFGCPRLAICLSNILSTIYVTSCVLYCPLTFLETWKLGLKLNRSFICKLSSIRLNLNLDSFLVASTTSYRTRNLMLRSPIFVARRFKSSVRSSGFSKDLVWNPKMWL